jgi:hypothetical protein
MSDVAIHWLTGPKPTSRYLSAVDERLGDLSLTEKTNHPLALKVNDEQRGCQDHSAHAHPAEFLELLGASFDGTFVDGETSTESAQV